MSSEILEAVQSIIGSFNPEEVFSSAKDFLGSGYVFTAVAGLIAIGAVKKLMKLLGIAIVAGVIWAAANYGLLDGILAQVGRI